MSVLKTLKPVSRSGLYILVSILCILEVLRLQKTVSPGLFQRPAESPKLLKLTEQLRDKRLCVTGAVLENGLQLSPLLFCGQIHESFQINLGFRRIFLTLLVNSGRAEGCPEPRHCSIPEAGFHKRNLQSFGVLLLPGNDVPRAGHGRRNRLHKLPPTCLFQTLLKSLHPAKGREYRL